jgi:hypothetical protein
MSESPWSEEGASAPKKKSVPTWAWWVGGGCLFLLLVVGVGGFFAVRFVGEKVQEWKDPEKQWENLREVLPFDQRPEGVDLVMSWHLGVDMYVLNDMRGCVVLLMQLPEKNGAQSREQLLDPAASHGLFGKWGRHGQTRMKIKVQGRELDALRFVQEGPARDAADEQGMPGSGAGATMVVDLTPEDAARPLVLQMTRSTGGDEPFDEQTVIDFLKPFHVGTQR